MLPAKLLRYFTNISQIFIKPIYTAWGPKLQGTLMISAPLPTELKNGQHRNNALALFELCLSFSVALYLFNIYLLVLSECICITTRAWAINLFGRLCNKVFVPKKQKLFQVELTEK